MPLDVIAFDADDTLWHTERNYIAAQENLATRLADIIDPETFKQALFTREVDNLEIYGYGAKSFSLSLIETTLDLTGEQLRPKDIRAILTTTRRMLTAEIELMDHVEATVRTLTRNYDLMVLTKGDLLEQRTKLARSGLAPYFRYVEVVSHKTPDAYREVLARYNFASERFLMVGNSLKSDVLPVLTLGGYGVHVAAPLIWAHEHVENVPKHHDRFFSLEHIDKLIPLLHQLDSSG